MSRPGTGGGRLAPTTARVLIVDPEVRFGLLLKRYLEERGWNAQWVSDGRKALAKWKDLNPHIVVTELQGEDLDGFEFLEALARLPWAPPVVVCTRLKGVETWSGTVVAGLGVRRVLSRPIRFPRLAEVLEQVMAELTATMAAIPAINTVGTPEQGDAAAADGRRARQTTAVP
jgi:CheY-like chemotaxis protein